MISFKIYGNTLLSPKKFTTTGSYNLNECTFEFDESWDGIRAKFAVFYREDHMDEADGVPIVEGHCSIPGAVLGENQRVFVGVFGHIVNADGSLMTRCTTNCVPIEVERGALVTGNPVTPTVWEQYYLDILKQAQNAQQKAKEAGLSAEQTIRFSELARLQAQAVNNVTEQVAQRAEELRGYVDIVRTLTARSEELYQNIVDSSGDSNAEIVEARGGFGNLGGRLSDADEKLTGLQETLPQKADSAALAELSAAVNGKLSRDEPIHSSQLAVDSDENKIQPSNLSESVLAMMAGTAPVSPAPANGSLVREKFAPNAVSEHSASFIEPGRNLFDAERASAKGWWRSTANGQAQSNEYTAAWCYSDYIPVRGGTSYVCNNFCHSVCFFDSAFQFLSGQVFSNVEADHPAFTAAENSCYVTLNIRYSERGILMLEAGTESSDYEPYTLKLRHSRTDAQLEALGTQIGQTGAQLETCANRIDRITTCRLLAKSTGDFSNHREGVSVFTGWALPFQKSGFSETITAVRLAVSVGDSTDVPVQLCFLDDAAQELAHYDAVLPQSGFLTVLTEVSPSLLTDTFYIGIRVKPGVTGTVLMLAKAVSDLDYPKPAAYYYTTAQRSWTLSDTYGYETADIKVYTGLGAIPAQHTHPKEEITGVDWPNITGEPFSIDLAAQYDAVIGDTLELFVDGILECRDASQYYVVFDAPKGCKYHRKWVYTPLAGDDDFTLAVSVYDTSRRLLAQRSALIRVHSLPHSPDAPFYLLCVGDSLTEGGTWCAELDRRLTGSGGIPAGNGFSNLHFIGGMRHASGTRFEGHGGYSFADYTSEGAPQYRVEVLSGMKLSDASGQSIWMDDGGNRWQLQTRDVPNSRLTFRYPDGASGYSLPESGTLRFLSGGGDNGNIAYQNAVRLSGNPFWSAADGRNDFKAYCAALGVPRIDACLLLMTWNGTKEIGTLIEQAKGFVDGLHTDYPACKIVLSGLQLPCEDGLGENYGSSTIWNSFAMDRFVHDLNRAYAAWCGEETYAPFLNFMQLCGQFDSAYSGIMEWRPVNQRSSYTELIAVNGVHPSQSGYLQIADAFYRKTIGWVLP
ncbi:hypothetical protein [Candidatus Soleaferrea massiliensis]|uniref:hypothetical protein n=1 Tax=Candidatus Soleaferrea massiliensis TaxID=1470354 RepID=UPI00058B6E0A|nr:hypothetical protein [Candidatus Soleaferrea massiliensis]